MNRWKKNRINKNFLCNIFVSEHRWLMITSAAELHMLATSRPPTRKGNRLSMGKRGTTLWSLMNPALVPEVTAEACGVSLLPCPSCFADDLPDLGQKKYPSLYLRLLYQYQILLLFISALASKLKTWVFPELFPLVY